MKNDQPPNSPDLEHLNKIIRQIKKKGNFTGVFLSYDDGTLVAKTLDNKVKDKISFKDFNPMIASVLKSGEKLSQTVGERNLVKIIAQLSNYSIIIIKCDNKELFLALLIDHSSPVGPLLDNLDEKIEAYIREINQYI
jgi:predicted regulator of Ras-like GTPase activity (Roadblock/LC7/MglB family)